MTSAIWQVIPKQFQPQHPADSSLGSCFVIPGETGETGPTSFVVLKASVITKDIKVW